MIDQCPAHTDPAAVVAWIRALPEGTVLLNRTGTAFQVQPLVKQGILVAAGARRRSVLPAPGLGHAGPGQARSVPGGAGSRRSRGQLTAPAHG